jgi:uncharacterized membrane protein YccF (DUF307 family)
VTTGKALSDRLSSLVSFTAVRIILRLSTSQLRALSSDARAAFTIALYTLLPFGQHAVSREVYTGHPDIGTGSFGTLGNLIWLLLAGWWLALFHIAVACILAVTIVGIPFAWAHLKLAGLALWPIGKTIISDDESRYSFRNLSPPLRR